MLVRHQLVRERTNRGARGELIDQGHTAIRQLAGQLGLKLDNLLSAERNGTEPFFYFDGKPYSEAEAIDDLKGIWQQLHADVSAASYPTLYNLSTERGRELDNATGAGACRSGRVSPRAP